MKIVRTLGRSFEAVGTIVLPDTARCNRGEQVYLPHPTRSYSLTPILYLRMKGVCKAVDSQRIPKYLEAWGFALQIVDETVLERSQKLALPWGDAMSADRSLIASPANSQSLLGLNSTEIPPALSWRIVTADSPNTAFVPISCPDTPYILSELSRVSYAMSLNTGDWVLLPLSGSLRLSSGGNRIQLTFDAQLLLDELIRL